MKSNILVIGGTGKTGRKVVERLEEQGQNVRVGSRNNNPPFEWGNTSTWTEALKGIDKVYIVYYPDLAVPGAYEAIQALTEAMIKAGIKKAVLLSGKGETEAERCEEVVANSGLDYTLVRASWFNQNFSESFLLEPVLTGFVALPMANEPIPFIDTNDIADVVVAALMDDDHNGMTYELTGPRTLTFKEVYSEIGEAIGRALTFQEVTIDEYHSMMKGAGLPDDYVWLIDYLFRNVLTNPKNQAVTNDVEKVLGRKATDFSEFINGAISSGVWNEQIPQSI